MMDHRRPFTIPHQAPALAMLAIWLAGAELLSGCASPRATLVIKSTQSPAAFSQSFSEAIYSQDEDGSYDIVLSRDAATDAATRGLQKNGKAGARLHPSDAPPLRHSVHIRVLWRPESGTRPDHPAATNASIDWYVTAPNMQGTTDILHYEGAGFVSVYAGDQRTRFHLRNVPVKLKDRLGDMKDPIGSSTLEGSFVAIRAPQRVQSRLRDIQDVLQKSTAPATPATRAQ